MSRRTLFSEEAIQKRVGELAMEISRDYQGQDIVLVGLLKGAFMFLHDLGVALELIKSYNKIDPVDNPAVGRVYIEFLSVSSYHDGHTSGELKLEMDTRRTLKGAHVILVEDVADTCKSLAWVIAHLRKKEPQSLRVCVLIAKPDKHLHNVEINYLGFSRVGLPFLAGYGMDDDGKDRCVKYIFEVPPKNPPAE